MADMTKAPEVGRLLIIDEADMKSMTPRTLIRYFNEGFIPVRRQASTEDCAVEFEFPSRVGVDVGMDAGSYVFSMTTALGNLNLVAEDIDSAFAVPDSEPDPDIH